MATIESSNPTLSQFRRHWRLGNGVRKQCSSWNLPSSDFRLVGAVNSGSGGGLLGAVKSPDTFASGRTPDGRILYGVSVLVG